MRIKFHSYARKEFFEAAEYYEEQVVGLWDDFIDEIEKVLDVIEQQPSSGTQITNAETAGVLEISNLEYVDIISNFC